MKLLKAIFLGSVVLLLSVAVLAQSGGSLKVSSFPSGANVWVDGVDTSKVTPMTVGVMVGTHKVVIQIPNSGWATDIREVDVVSGNNDLSVTLLPLLTTGPQGPQGPKGDTGAGGPAGPQGPKGDTGAVGPAGLQGPKGDTGAVGPAGLQGAQGDTGAAGPAGSQGPKGDTGAAGPTGMQGPKGDTGGTGPEGGPGPVGPAGPSGPTGPQGPEGPTNVFAKVVAPQAVIGGSNGTIYSTSLSLPAGSYLVTAKVNVFQFYTGAADGQVPMRCDVQRSSNGITIDNGWVTSQGGYFSFQSLVAHGPVVLAQADTIDLFCFMYRPNVDHQNDQATVNWVHLTALQVGQITQQ